MPSRAYHLDSAGRYYLDWQTIDAVFLPEAKRAAMSPETGAIDH
jgi:hypothetical protein